MEDIHNKIIRDFPNSTIIEKYVEDKHMLIKISIADLLNIPFINWDYNRPPDKQRCKDIALNIYYLKLTYVWLLNVVLEDETYKIFDGIHRYEALKIYQLYDNTKNLHTYIFINLYYNTTKEHIIREFININKCIPIPELYLELSDNNKKEIIENVVNKWISKYPKNFTTSYRPKRPNINRDMFIDFVSKMFKKYNINRINYEILENKLIQLNKYVSINLPIDINNRLLEKCNITGCYLFLYKLDVLEEFLNNID